MVQTPYLNPLEAAAFLGLSVATLASKRTRGDGPKYYKQGRVFYKTEDLIEWIENNSCTSTAQARAKNKLHLIK